MKINVQSFKVIVTEIIWTICLNDLDCDLWADLVVGQDPPRLPPVSEVSYYC